MKQTITIPDSWKDVKVNTFQELHNAEDKLIERLSILIDQDPEDIKKWDIHSLTKVSNLLAWTNKLPDSETWKREIVIGDKTYYFKEKLSSLSGGQWLDIEIWLQDSINNLHKIVGLMYGCDSEIVRTQFNVEDCYGCLLFFSTIEKESLLSIQDFLIVETIKMKLKESQKAKENKDLQRKRRWLSGLGLGSFMGWQKETQLN